MSDFMILLRAAVERYKRQSHTGRLVIELHFLNGEARKAKLTEETKLRGRSVALVEHEALFPTSEPLTAMREVL